MIRHGLSARTFLLLAIGLAVMIALPLVVKSSFAIDIFIRILLFSFIGTAWNLKMCIRDRAWGCRSLSPSPLSTGAPSIWNIRSAVCERSSDSPSHRIRVPCRLRGHALGMNSWNWPGELLTLSLIHI